MGQWGNYDPYRNTHPVVDVYEDADEDDCKDHWAFETEAQTLAQNEHLRVAVF